MNENKENYGITYKLKANDMSVLCHKLSMVISLFFFGGMKSSGHLFNGEVYVCEFLLEVYKK